MSRDPALDILHRHRPPAAGPDATLVARERAALRAHVAATAHDRDAAHRPAHGEAADAGTARAPARWEILPGADDIGVGGDDPVPRQGTGVSPGAGPVPGARVATSPEDADLAGEGRTVRLARPSPRRGTSIRRRRLWGAGAVVAVAVALAAAGWAAVWRDPALTTSIQCADLGTIEARTGDPVVDCGTALRAVTGTAPPPLVAYTDATGANIYVIDAGEAPPAGWAPLADGFRQDVRLGELADELDDVGRGLESGCFTQPEAEALVHGQLDRLGLDGWTLRTDPPAPGEPQPGPDVCAMYVHYLDGDVPRQLVIRAVAEGEPAAAGGLVQPRRLARALSERMLSGPDARCLSLEEARAAAVEEAARLGLDLSGPAIDIDARPAPHGAGPTCARPTTRVGGLVQVVLREVPAGHLDG